MWANFVAAWFDTCAVIGSVLGGIAAVIVAVLLLAAFVIILLAIVDLLFDKITGAMARHWVKTGKQPARRWAEIIARGRCDEEQ